MGLWSDFRKWTGAVFGSRKEIVLDPSTHLSEFSEFVPRGFANGLELLNDQSTPMLFIVEELSKHLGVTLHEAAKIAWEIHTRGGALVPLSSGARRAGRGERYFLGCPFKAVSAGLPRCLTR